MRKTNKRPSCHKIVLKFGRSRSCKIRGTQQPQFAPFKENLQIRDGAVHHLVLLRAAIWP